MIPFVEAMMKIKSHVEGLLPRRLKTNSKSHHILPRNSSDDTETTDVTGRKNRGHSASNVEEEEQHSGGRSRKPKRTNSSSTIGDSQFKPRPGSQSARSDISVDASPKTMGDSPKTNAGSETSQRTMGLGALLGGFGAGADAATRQGTAMSKSSRKQGKQE